MKEILRDKGAVIEKHFEGLRRLLKIEEDFERHESKTDGRDQKLEDQAKQGKALLRLKLVETHYSPSGHRLLTFEPSDQPMLPRYSLRAGDIVSLGSKKPSSGASGGNGL